MSWRYVAAVEAIDGEEIWTIREFYDGRGWTARAVAPTGSTHAELREVLRMMTFDIEHRDFLDLDAGEVAHRPGGLRADLTRPGEGPLVPVLDADGLPVVTTVGDLTARHIGRLVLPGTHPRDFVEEYFLDAQGMTLDDLVTRIEWRYLDESEG